MLSPAGPAYRNVTSFPCSSVECKIRTSEIPGTCDQRYATASLRTASSGNRSMKRSSGVGSNQGLPIRIGAHEVCCRSRLAVLKQGSSWTCDLCDVRLRRYPLLFRVWRDEVAHLLQHPPIPIWRHGRGTERLWSAPLVLSFRVGRLTAIRKCQPDTERQVRFDPVSCQID